jgi:hypothetical protein
VLKTGVGLLKHEPTKFNSFLYYSPFQQQQFVFKCEEINKRSLGKAIIQFCGNEGTENDANKATLRRLLQAVISHVENEKSHIWQDAEVTIYDDLLDVYKIRSGDGKHAFLATLDEYDSPKVLKTKKSRVNAGHHHSSGCPLM